MHHLNQLSLLALDIGEKRVGSAIFKNIGGSAHPHKTFRRGSGNAEKEIVDLVIDKNIETIVVGMPLSEDNSKNEQCLRVERFCRRLARRVKAKIVYFDEYGSSIEAKRRLNLNTEAKERQARQKGLIDSMSASIILEEFWKAETAEG